MHSQAVGRWIAKLAGRSELSPSDVDALGALPFVLEKHAARSEIVGVGELTTRACVVVSGLVARCEILGDGERQITALYQSSDMPDLHSLVIPLAVTGLVALCPTLVMRVPHEALRRLTELHPKTAIAFWRECSIDATIAHAWVVNVGRRQAVERIAHLICELAARDGGHDGQNAFGFTLELNQGHLADATGMSVVHVNRALKTLRERGLFTKSVTGIQVHDWQGLQRLAQFDPDYLSLVPDLAA